MSGGARAWPKGTGLEPVGVGLRGFKPHPPHTKQGFEFRAIFVYSYGLIYSYVLSDLLSALKGEGSPHLFGITSVIFTQPCI